MPALKTIVSGAFAFSLVWAGLPTDAAEPVKWRNVDDAHHLAGRRTSEGYLRGKVVMVDRWGVRCPPCRALLPRLEVLWQTFNAKPFVLVGGHCRGWGTPEQVKRLAAKNGLTYPIYEEFSLAKGAPRFDAIPFLYVVDPAGEVIYAGNDEREATDYVVSAISDLDDPATPERWKYHLAYETELLPGRALLRIRAFRKRFPEEAMAYEETERKLARIPEIEKLAKLLEIVRKVRSFRPRNPAEEKRFRQRIDETISKYCKLKDHSDPRVVQEAKNALADLQWAKTEK